MLIFGVLGSQITEYLIRKKCLKKLTVRRMGAGVVSLGTFYMLFMAYLPCDVIENNIGFLLVLSAFRAGYYFSVAPSAIDISPTYQSTLVATNNAAMLVPGFTVPMVMSAVGDENARTKRDWEIIFLISYVIINVSILFYAFTTSSEVRPLTTQP